MYTRVHYTVHCRRQLDRPRGGGSRAARLTGNCRIVTITVIIVTSYLHNISLHNIRLHYVNWHYVNRYYVNWHYVNWHYVNWDPRMAASPATEAHIHVPTSAIYSLVSI